MTSHFYMCFTNLFLSLAVLPLEDAYSVSERASCPDELSSKAYSVEQ